MSDIEVNPQDCLNFNIGVLGHVDSGKTSLCMALSQISSTACFDRNPQSRERGITLDLGFSSFISPMPPHLAGVVQDSLKHVQYTLVDCPGHASLVRTIIGGAQIIDLMLLVIDVSKGIQTQTAECLVIGEITSPTNRMIIVLNKADLLADANEINKLTKRIQKVLSTTRFAEARFVTVSARPAGGDITIPTAAGPSGIELLLHAIEEETYLPVRIGNGPFIFAVDHCFTVKGQGTVMTGTALSGRAAVDDMVDIPTLAIQRKIKSIQRFKKPVRVIIQGDRAGICVTQFDASLLERGFASSPGALRYASAVVCNVQRIAYFKHYLRSKMRLHVTSGHSTVIGTMTFFQPVTASSPASAENNRHNLFSTEHAYIEEIPNKGAEVADESLKSEENSGDGLHSQSSSKFDAAKPLLALIVFEQPIIVAQNALIIASKLDADIHLNQCRLAFYGRILHTTPTVTSAGVQSHATERQQRLVLHELLRSLRIFRDKFKRGTVERASDADGTTLIVRNLFKKETDLTKFCNKPVLLSTGERGVIESGFGQSGKVKVGVPGGLKPETLKQLSEKSAPKGTKISTADDASKSISVILTFRKYYGAETIPTSK